jgi:3-oxoacyl-[acyl-carrier-protein] synthase-3
MDGPQVFRRAVLRTVESAKAALEHAKVNVEDVALFVPHQANLRIIRSVAERLGIPLERATLVLERTGNTSAASIPLAMADAIEARRVQRGDIVLVSAFAAGLTWASAVIEW